MRIIIFLIVIKNYLCNTYNFFQTSLKKIPNSNKNKTSGDDAIERQ